MRLHRLAACVVIVLAAGRARAQDVDPEQLFKDGSALMEAGKYDAALSKLERAQKAEPGIGTQFNIAVCQRKLGRLGSAYRGFRGVASLARASGKKAREDAARAELAELRAAVAAFAVTSLEKEEVTVRIDGAALTKDDWAFYPVDPGEHTVEAIAHAKKRWSLVAPTPSAGRIETITVPLLATDAVTITRETTNGRRTLAFALGGVGLAGIITAGITGGLLLDAKATADEKCPPDPATGTLKCNGDSVATDAVSRGKTLLPVNAIAWGVAALGLGTGAFLLLTSDKRPDPPKAAGIGRSTTTRVTTMLVPSITSASGGAALIGTF